MELRHLRLVQILADEGGITKSLERLYLTQSAVSHQLKDIEERLGTKLFFRSKNEWRLTEEGKVIYETARIVLAEVDKARAAIAAMKNGEAGTIRLSTECYTTYHWFPSFLQQMKLLYPNLTVRIVMEATHRPIAKLLENELDIALTSDPVADKSIRYIELFRDEVLAVVSSAHPWARKTYITAEDFASETLIIHSYPLETVTVYEHFLKKAGVMPVQITAIPLTEVALEMVKAGMGITCMPLWALKSFTVSPDIRFIRIGKKGLFRTHLAAIKQTDSHKKHITDFIQLLKEEISE